MLALGPTHVYVCGELVVSEQEWIGAVGVTHRRPAGEHQRRLTRIVGARAIGPRNLQHIQSEVSDADVDRRLRARHLAGVAASGVDQKVGRDDMSEAEPNILDAAITRSGLTAVEGAATGCSQFLRIGDAEWLDAVTAEEAGGVRRGVGHLPGGGVGSLR